MLKKILATNSVYLSIKHTDEILSKYFENLKKYLRLLENVKRVEILTTY